MIVLFFFSLVKSKENCLVVCECAHWEWLEEPLDGRCGVADAKVLVDVEVEQQTGVVEDDEVEHSVVHVGNPERVAVGGLLDLVRFDEVALDVDRHQFFVWIDAVLDYFVVHICYFHKTNCASWTSSYDYCNYWIWSCVERVAQSQLLE